MCLMTPPTKQQRRVLLLLVLLLAAWQLADAGWIHAKAMLAQHLLARAWPELFAYQFILEATITTLDEEAVSS